MFIPADPILVEFAEQIMEERDHQLEEEIEKLLGGGAGGTGVESDYNPISADGMAHDTIIETDRVSIEEKQKAEQLCRKHKFPTNFDPTLMALAMRDLAQRENVQPDPSSSAIPPIETPSHQLRNRLRKVVSTLARRLAFLTYGKASKEHFQEIYTMLKRMDGASQDTATIEQFKRRIEYLERKIKETVKRGESTA
jgi:hypothetical protein